MIVSKTKQKGGRVMDTLLTRFSSSVKGVIAGFDRIVFKGMLRPIMFAAGMQSFLMTRNVLNKDFKAYAIAQSQAIVASAEEISKMETGRPITYISSSNERKETLAHNRQKETKTTEGLVGVWSCVESCWTYRSTFNAEASYPILRQEQSRCKHLYFYYDDPIYGFMSIRLQTWAPYEIQIALNGREWLRRSLDSAGCDYILSGNKFLHIDDYDLAQGLLDAQLTAAFESILNRFLPNVFPLMSDIVPGISYYWTLWQSELAKDYIFKEADTVQSLMNDFMRHALVSGCGERILHYFGSPVKANGQPHPNSNPEILSRTKLWYDGLRVRHWNGKNSLKFYNVHNVLRFEMTMNDPAKYKIYRHAENQDKSEPKKLMPIRKGIADITARAGVASQAVSRFTEHMASVKETTSLEKLLESISTPVIADGKRHRALDAFGKDLPLLRAIADPFFDVENITNKELRIKLAAAPWAKNMNDKQLSGRISRHLLLLRKHGLIKKLPKQRKYALTDKGRKITSAVTIALTASVDDLLALAA